MMLSSVERVCLIVGYRKPLGHSVFTLDVILELKLISVNVSITISIKIFIASAGFLDVIQRSVLYIFKTKDKKKDFF